jgi:hypothetical protein
MQGAAKSGYFHGCFSMEWSCFRDVTLLIAYVSQCEVIQTWFNSGSGMEAGVSQLRHVGHVSIVRRGDSCGSMGRQERHWQLNNTSFEINRTLSFH